jgi:Fur family ferric uptake transcriptional regulator
VFGVFGYLDIYQSVQKTLKHPNTQTLKHRRKDLLPERNMRMTRQRKMILEELRRVNNHPSADELYERVRKYLPRISLGTVYRNLEVLSELGEIQKLELSGSLKRFDGNPKKHYHIRCMNCDRVDDAPMGFMESIESQLTGATDYKIMGHRLEFVGLCPQCFEKAAGRWQSAEKQ